jgi:integrase
MRLQDYDERDGKRVWLTGDEVELLLKEAQSGEQRRAFMLGARAGLRRSEITSVTVADFLHGPDGFVRVWEDYAKRDKYREAPIPDELESVVVNSLQYELSADTPVVDKTGGTVYRWVKRAAERLQAETGDVGWSYLDVHDLRRTWGGDLLWNQGLLPTSVMQFGGWDDWETFRDAYLGEMSPEAARREREKVSWMGAGAQPTDEQSPPSTIFEPNPGGQSQGTPY